MKDLEMQSVNQTKLNIEAIAELFPNCITESHDSHGNLKRSIDFDLLRQELSEDIVEGTQERYTLNWPGKKEAILAANAPIAKTLRPCREDSINFDTTENLFIEGDNLEALKLLQENYLGKVKMIYIDPPYNTGNDFVYNDDFAESTEEFFEKSQQTDDVGNRMMANTDSNGRFHSDWLSMMYSRLKLARNLLSDDGSICISIDENEIHNLRRICDEIFGENNFISQAGWQKVYSPKNQAKLLSNDYEFVLMYAKSINHFQIGLLPRTEEMNKRYKNPDNDSRGVWKAGDLVASGERTGGRYIIKNPKTNEEYTVPPGKHWAFSEQKMNEMLNDNRIFFGLKNDSFPSFKQFLSEVKQGRVASSFFSYQDYGHTDGAKKEFISLFGDNGRTIFETLKPTKLIQNLFRITSTNNNDIILDFFAGSGTTAHAVMQLNAEDGGNRKFIMVQLPELTDEKSEAYKAGYKTIAEISKERIRRAGAQIVAQHSTAQHSTAQHSTVIPILRIQNPTITLH
ncbi:site-specific DNA-methyltransferase [Pelistega sp. MC2]|uniref:site-specific DNA-methyltransferase n=1 Tax=Pelistega sp. MC2 TaxID=1720297 RepID=UPI000A3EE435|nr:site-specific DNA-methyltransferase [Pelistega sp. MC2]